MRARAPPTLTHPDANSLARPSLGQCVPRHPNAGCVRLPPRQKTPAVFAAVRTEDLRPVGRRKVTVTGRGDAATLAPHRRLSRAVSIFRPLGLGLLRLDRAVPSRNEAGRWVKRVRGKNTAIGTVSDDFFHHHLRSAASFWATRLLGISMGQYLQCLKNS